MTSLGRLVLVGVLDCACTRPPDAAPAIVAAPIEPESNGAQPQAVIPVAETCKLPLDDARARRRSGELDDPIELDGDGRADVVVRACHGGNCDFLLYLAEPQCPRYVGTISGSFTDQPSCVEPPNGSPCTISLMRFMIHGDMQEYLFAFSPTTGEYAEIGPGERYVEPPPAAFR